MARYRIELVVEEANIKSVESKLRKHFGKEAATSVKKIDLATSRVSRLADCQSNIEDAASEVECLKDEIQDWYDNLPESFQNGSKGEALQECVDSLETLQGELEGIDFSSVSFPGMYD